MKTYTYHKSHSFIDKEGVTINFASQLYKLGIYVIVNSTQLTLEPKDIIKIEQNLEKEQKAGNITNLVFSFPITVTEGDSGWKEYKEEEEKDK